MIDVVCKVCNQNLSLPDPGLFLGPNSSSMRSLLLSISQGVLHEGCFARRTEDLHNRQISVEYAARAAMWAGICPPAFQDTDVNRLCLPHHAEAFSWAYGAQGLFLHGQTRGGKSRTSYAILNREHRMDRTIVACSHRKFSDDATFAIMRTTDREARRWADLVRKCSILFVDDLGKAPLGLASGAQSQATSFLFDTFSNRCDNHLPTMFTSNFSGADLLERLPPDCGEPFVARILEECLAIQFPVTQQL